MKIERRKVRTAEVFTASLNDIMFFLMLFFLIIATMVTPAAIKVLLPNSSTAEKVVTKKNISLVINHEHQYFLEDKLVSFEQLEPALRAEIEQKKREAQTKNEELDLNVLLQADRSLNLQDVVNVIDVGNKLQVKMVLFTQKD
ncbi:biopolymer transport protein ExbD [Dysgonomonas sp. PH5-45]|uniref:ExbD/TolR family protein n=1 Tax=unclassified Dysgonomonas TaxID=2630389 RepID=UPI00247723E3|nr:MULTISPECIES: biopolymer transporter ExbD [unclassified Dysgonomonas]MDH6355739.1 biopolymer transport protein ExbD [Dysgonomonas sp. PH5-45]MDH6388636.1 biopolymer transport protein ExbD [Dysgonomonas sp. PH5-37]